MSAASLTDGTPTPTSDNTTKQNTSAKHVSFDASLPSEPAESRKPTRKRSRRHLVYALKLTEEGFLGWSAAHLPPPPMCLERGALQERWAASKAMMALLIPWRCSDEFDLPAVNGSHITLARDGVPVVPLADNRARSKRHRHPPPDEVVAEVAKSIFQPGAEPDWYQVVP
ncbi:hypothetical protein EV715DRAFT_210612 [Schizophyllum commune]